jgi:hypothetical protein
MCIRYIKKYTGCPHTGVIYSRCDIYLNNPDTQHDITKHPETINGLCRECGGGPQPEPVITYLDLDSISSWAQESASIEEKETASTFSTDSRVGVELLRKGSQRAVGGVKRLIGSMRSNRSSAGSSVLETGTAETEWGAGSVGKSTYPCVGEVVDERKMVDTLGKGCRVKCSRRCIGGSLEPIHLSQGTNGSVQGVRHSLGRDTETASVVTTWTGVIGLVNGAEESGREREDGVGVCQERIEVEQTSKVPEPGIVGVEQADRDLCKEKIDVGQTGVVMDQKRLEELAKADDKLVRVRDGRGYINCDVI